MSTFLISVLFVVCLFVVHLVSSAVADHGDWNIVVLNNSNSRSQQANAFHARNVATAFRAEVTVWKT